MLATVTTGPVLWLPFTLGVYWMSSELYRRAGKTPLLNPTLLTIAAICSALVGLGVPYPTYFQSVSILHYLLGTAVVALAIPMHRNLRKLTNQLRRITIALVAGSLTSIVCGLLIAKVLKASGPTAELSGSCGIGEAVRVEVAQVLGYPSIDRFRPVVRRTGVSGR